MPTEDELDKERVRGLGCDGATLAEALASVTGWPAFALDPDDLEKSTSGPLRTAAEVFSHYRPR